MANELKSAIQKVVKNEAASLILADRDLDDKDAKYVKFWKNISAALEENRALRKLDLSENNIGDVGVSMLAGALKKNTGLRRLDLSGNDEINDRGAVDIANALKKNRSLVYLNLSHSQVGDEAAKAFASMFERNTTLQTLHLSSCLIHSAGALAFLIGLEKNSTLQHLNVEDNPGLPSEWHEKIQQMLTPEARAERRRRIRADRISGGTSTREDEVDEPPSPSSPVSPNPRSGRVTGLDVHSASPWIPAEICSELVDTYHKNNRRKMGLFDNTAQRGISVQQLENLGGLIQAVLNASEILDTQAPADSPTKGRPLRWEMLNMYHVNDYFTKAITAPFKCSWIEFIAKDRQPPQWMISHAWSTPFAYSVAMISTHAKARNADQWQSSTYWCCTFANNQHDLAELDEQDIMATPFARVLLSHQCLGTLLLCDPKVTPLKRIWCVFEAHITAQLQSGSLAQKGWHLLDVAVPVLDGNSEIAPFKVTLLQDAGNGNFLERCDTPGIYFPLEVARVGTEVNIFNAQASREEDRNSILNYVANQHCSRKTPPESHEHYDQLNLFIHRTFASAELYRLACERPANLAGIVRLLELRADPTRFVRNGNTAIHAAVGADPSTASTNLANSAELLEMLLKAGSDPNVVNSQLCTALDYASKLPEQARACLCPVLKDFGAKPFDDVALQIESDMNVLLRSIVAQGFESEGRAFGGRTLGNTDARLMWPARHALQVVATNLCLYPHAACHLSVQEACNSGMTSTESAKVRAKAEQRADLVLRVLRSAGCVNPMDVVTARQDTLLSISFTFENSRPKLLGQTLSLSEKVRLHLQARKGGKKSVLDEAAVAAGNAHGSPERRGRFYVHGMRISAQSPAGASCLGDVVQRVREAPASAARRRVRSPSGGASGDGRHGSPVYAKQKSHIKHDAPDLCMVALGSPCHGNSSERLSDMAIKSPLQQRNGSPTTSIYRLAEDGRLASSPFQRRKAKDGRADGDEFGNVSRRRPNALADVFDSRGRASSNPRHLGRMNESASDVFLCSSQSPGAAHGRALQPRLNESASDGFLGGRSPLNAWSNATVARLPSATLLPVAKRSEIEVAGLSLQSILQKRA